jgi:hypothetical protein
MTQNSTKIRENFKHPAMQAHLGAWFKILIQRPDIKVIAQIGDGNLQTGSLGFPCFKGCSPSGPVETVRGWNEIEPFGNITYHNQKY